MCAVIYWDSKGRILRWLILWLIRYNGFIIIVFWWNWTVDYEKTLCVRWWQDDVKGTKLVILMAVIIFYFVSEKKAALIKCWQCVDKKTPVWVFGHLPSCHQSIWGCQCTCCSTQSLATAFFRAHCSVSDAVRPPSFSYASPFFFPATNMLMVGNPRTRERRTPPGPFRHAPTPPHVLGSAVLPLPPPPLLLLRSEASVYVYVCWRLHEYSG